MAEGDPASLETSVPATMMAEVRAISAAAEFRRAPVMTRLLDYLVHETLAGRGDQLKAYAVAVDGLGRAPDFDAQGDSYPRVQVGRLRKMLAKYYAHHPRAVRLTIPQGGYRVTLEDAGPADQGQRSSNQMWWTRRFRRKALILIAVLLASVAVIISSSAWRSEPSQASGPLLVPPPMLEVGLVVATREHDGLRELVWATLLDGLRRTEAVQVKAPRRLSKPDPTPIPARYRLAADILGRDQPVLFLRLWRVSPDRLIWSDQVAVPSDPARLSETLAPTFAALTQSPGVIPAHERIELGRSFAPGYPCLLKYEQYRVERLRAQFAPVRRCVEETLKLAPEHAQALAASSILALDEAILGMPPLEGDAGADIPQVRLRKEALALARRAVAADPFSASANFALSRASLASGNCPAAVRSGLRALTLDPYDPSMFSGVGIYLIDCGDPRGEKLLRQAIALDPNTPVYNAPLVYLEVARGNGKAAREALRRMEQSSPSGKPIYYLTAAIALGASGDVNGAAAAWKQLTALDPDLARDPDKLFARWRLSPTIRAKCLAALRQAGLIPAAPPAAPRREPGTR